MSNEDNSGIDSSSAHRVTLILAIIYLIAIYVHNITQPPTELPTAPAGELVVSKDSADE